MLVLFPEVVPEPHPLLLVVEDPLGVHADLQAPVVATLLASAAVAEVGVAASTVWTGKKRGEAVSRLFERHSLLQQEDAQCLQRQPNLVPSAIESVS